MKIESNQVKSIFESYTKAFAKLDWSNPESQILLHQAIYRIFALVNKDFFIMHASATVTPKGLTIAFGDDGKSVGKTTCAFEVARQSGKFIADEFLLYRRGIVFANGEYPIHFKEGAREFFEYMGRDFTNWIYPSKEFEIVDDSSLDAIVCPVLAKTNKIVKLSGEAADKARRITACAHIAKLLHPELDRVSIFTGSNEQGACVKDISEMAGDLPEFVRETPIYEMRYKSFRDVIPLLKEVNLY